MKNPDVSLILVTYKEVAELLACLKTITKAHRSARAKKTPAKKARPPLQPKIEVIIVDNDAQSRLKSTLAKHFPAKKSPYLRYVKTGANIGFGPANNVGAAHARGEYLFFLNPDTEMLPGAITELWSFLERRPRAAIVAPTLLTMEGERYPDQGSAELTPLTAVAAHSLFHRLWPSNPIAHQYWVRDRDLNKPQQLAVVPGTAFMIRRSIFEHIGGFDEQFFIYFEESDLCRRVREETGKEVWLIPTAQLKHIWHAATKDAKYNLIFRESRAKYFQKYYGPVVGGVTEKLLQVGKYEVLAGAAVLAVVVGFLLY